MDKRYKRWKDIRDAVHGQIDLHPLCVSIVDTPEFQRLRDISQCGLCHLVFPSACHSRFEHSLGVYHLAGVMLKKLKETEDISKKINEKDELCIQIAALCHDIGHGPFSHTWERFLKSAGVNYEHEQQSIKMLDYLIEENNLTEQFSQYDINIEEREFIKNLILGNCTDPKKGFLFEIVANKETGMDVDKWDYILRDALHFGIKTELNYERILSSVSVIECDGMTHIAYRDKVAPNLLEVFEIRAKLHKVCYQHRVSKILEIMLIDALLLVDQYYTVEMNQGKVLRMSDCHSHLEAFTKLTDYIYYALMNSTDENLAPGRKIITRILKRKCYTAVGLNVLHGEKTFEIINYGFDNFVSFVKNEMLSKLEHYKNFNANKLRLSLIDISSKDNKKLKKIICFDKNFKRVEFPCEIKSSDIEALLLYTDEKENIDSDLLKKMKDIFCQLCCS